MEGGIGTRTAEVGRDLEAPAGADITRDPGTVEGAGIVTGGEGVAGAQRMRVLELEGEEKKSLAQAELRRRLGEKSLAQDLKKLEREGLLAEGKEAVEKQRIFPQGPEAIEAAAAARVA